MKAQCVKTGQKTCLAWLGRVYKSQAEFCIVTLQCTPEREGGRETEGDREKERERRQRERKGERVGTRKYCHDAYYGEKIYTEKPWIK